MNALLAVLLLCFLICFGGCSPNLQGREASAPSTRVDLLTSGEMASFSNAYDAILSLRQNWIRGRGNDRRHAPAVLIDGILTPGVEVLTSIHPDHIFGISYLSSSEAITRFGPISAGGVILVSTKR